VCSDVCEKEQGQRQASIPRRSGPAQRSRTPGNKGGGPAGAEITNFAEEIEHGSTFYEGSWKTPAGANMDVLVTPTGDLVEIEEQISIDKVPAAALKVARKAAGKEIELAFEKKTMILYEVKFQKGENRHELLLTPDGRRVEEAVEKGKPEDE
jgi:hypothetical protein